MFTPQAKKKRMEEKTKATGNRACTCSTLLAKGRKEKPTRPEPDVAPLSASEQSRFLKTPSARILLRPISMEGGKKKRKGGKGEREATLVQESRAVSLC